MRGEVPQATHPQIIQTLQYGSRRTPVQMKSVGRVEFTRHPALYHTVNFVAATPLCPSSCPLWRAMASLGACSLMGRLTSSTRLARPLCCAHLFLLQACLSRLFTLKKRWSSVYCFQSLGPSENDVSDVRNMNLNNNTRMSVECIHKFAGIQLRTEKTTSVGHTAAIDDT